MTKKKKVLPPKLPTEPGEHSFETRPGQVIGSRVRWVDSG